VTILRYCLWLNEHIEYFNSYHFILDYVQKGAVSFQYIQTNDQMVDIFTKALCRQKLAIFRDKMWLVQNPFLVKSEC
jgi:hypothetical protein